MDMSDYQPNVAFFKRYKERPISELKEVIEKETKQYRQHCKKNVSIVFYFRNVFFWVWFNVLGSDINFYTLTLLYFEFHSIYGISFKMKNKSSESISPPLSPKDHPDDDALLDSEWHSFMSSAFQFCTLRFSYCLTK